MGGVTGTFILHHTFDLFQCVDAPSLLRLLLNFDLLEAAAELVLEYVDAVMGRGHQYFGIEVKVKSHDMFTTCVRRWHLLVGFTVFVLLLWFQRPLSATSPPAWLPYTSIDQLLQALNETQTHSAVRRLLFV